MHALIGASRTRSASSPEPSERTRDHSGLSRGTVEANATEPRPELSRRTQVVRAPLEEPRAFDDSSPAERGAHLPSVRVHVDSAPDSVRAGYIMPIMGRKSVTFDMSPAKAASPNGNTLPAESVSQ
jgi:hypothetical protein